MFGRRDQKNQEKVRRRRTFIFSSEQLAKQQKSTSKQTLDDAFAPGSKKYQQSLIDHVNDT